jgi:hypothetical protein
VCDFNDLGGIRPAMRFARWSQSIRCRDTRLMTCATGGVALVVHHG